MAVFDRKSRYVKPPLEPTPSLTDAGARSRRCR